MKYDLYPLVENTNSLKLSVFAGPTCDACDVVMRDVMFPELEIGDCVFSKRIGAYSWASRSNFNLLGETKIVHHDFDLEEVENYVQALSLSEMHCL